MNDNRKQEQAAAAVELQVVVEKRQAFELLASDANNVVVGAAAVGVASGTKKIVDKLRGSGGQGGGQDGGTKTGPPAER